MRSAPVSNSGSNGRNEGRTFSCDCLHHRWSIREKCVIAFVDLWRAISAKTPTTQTDCGSTTQTDCSSTTQTDCGCTTQTDCSSTTQTDCGSTTQTDCSSTTQTDCSSTTQTDCGSTTQTDLGCTTQTDCSRCVDHSSIPFSISGNN